MSAKEFHNRPDVNGEAVPFGDTRLPDRFWSKVVVTDDGCWQWSASMLRGGYGSYKIKGKTFSTHRVAWRALVGEVPEGLVLDHLCRNRACVNPSHLRVCTLRENTTGANSNSPSALNARKVICKRGHVLSGDNLRIDPKGQRICRECRRTMQRERRWLRRMRQEADR